MDNINTVLIDLPTKVNAIVSVDENLDYTIFINARLSDDEQKRAYLHEMEHINNGHFFSHKNIEVIEEEAYIPPN